MAVLLKQVEELLLQLDESTGLGHCPISNDRRQNEGRAVRLACRM